MTRTARSVPGLRRTLHLALVVHLAAACLFVANVASAERVAVLNVMSETSQPQADALTVALRNAMRHAAGHKLAPGEFSLEVMVLALGCDEPPNQECQTRIAARAGVDRYVWGIMRREGSLLVTHLHLWQRNGSERQLRLRYSDNLTESADDTLRALARGALAELFLSDDKDQASSNAEGLLVVTAGSVDGVLFIDGQNAGKIEDGYAERMVPLGKHHVRVQAREYRDAEGSIKVHGDGPSDLMLTPRRVRKVEPLPSIRMSEEEEEARSGNAGGWFAVGAGAILIGGGVYSTLRYDDIQKDPRFVGYGEGLSATQDTCHEAQHGTVVTGAASPAQVSEMCKQARMFDAARYVLFGLGAVSAGSGLIILLAGDGVRTEREQVKRFEPNVAVLPGGGRVDMRWRF